MSTAVISQIARDLRRAYDPALLMRNLGLIPDPWQARVMQSEAKRVLMLCARQTGKSQVAATMALYEALYHPPALILLLSPTLRQSQELFKKVMAFYQGPNVPMLPEQESALRLELPNKSRIISLPGKEETVRGYSGARLLVIDEAARVDDGLYLAVRPMLAVSQGRIVCLSTPFGKRGFFYEEWKSERTWERFKIVATECPRITPEFLAEEKAAMGERWYKQEFECEFVDVLDQAFATEYVMKAFQNDLKPLFGPADAQPDEAAKILSSDITPLFPE